MNELILVKLGGSLITEKGKPFTEDIETIRRLAGEIHEARAGGKFGLIVGHGGGSYPHLPAKQFRTNEGIVDKSSYEGIAKVQDAAARLNRIVTGELIRAGENAMSIQLSACSTAEDGRIKYVYLDPIRMLLDDNMVPVPYGDVALDTKKGCCIISTEEILTYISHAFTGKYKPSRVIVCGRTDGVFTANPDENGDAKLIPEVTPRNIAEVGNYLAGSSGIDVTGGMKQKVESILELAKMGIESEIINGKKPGLLKRALLGEKGLGTIIRS
jgi:isopentenyl phosphate kinase